MRYICIIIIIIIIIIIRPLLANSACTVNLSEESGTLVSHPAFPTWRRLTLTHSHQGQIRINLDPQPSGSNRDSEERNEVVLPGQGPQKALIARDRSQKSTQGNTVNGGKKTDVKKIG